MTLTRWFAVPAIAAVTLIGNVAIARHTEVLRVQAHLDSALTALSAGTATAMLAPSQRAERVALLDTLRAYRDAGVFPHNYDFPGRLVPYFVDRKTGTLCAVGYLMAATGRRDIVDRVARSNNNVYVRMIASDTAFTGWLSSHGLTVADAERIQVVYAASQPPRALLIAGAAAVGVASFSVVGSVGTGLWNATANRDGHGTGSTKWGAVTGVLSLGTGVALLNMPGRARVITEIGAGTAAVGGLSLGLAYRAIQHRNQLAASGRTSSGSSSHSSGVEASLAPIVGLGRNSATGLSLSLRY